MFVIKHPVLNDFRVLTLLGCGSFSSVYLAESVDYHFLVAMKKMNKEFNCVKEIALTEQAQYPLIVNVYDTFEFNGSACMMMEYVEGQTLLDYVNAKGPLTEEEARCIFAELVLVVHHLHNNLNIIHRDLKCENIMMDSMGNIRLIDFGFARKINALMGTPCGSPSYVAPEMIKDDIYGKQIDIWAMGVILYAITVGCLPFDGTNINQIFKKITHTNPPYPLNMSDQLKDLIQGMLCKNPQERLSIQQILENEWLKVPTSKTFMRLNTNAVTNISVKPEDLQGLMNQYSITMEEAMKNPKSKDAILLKILKSRLQFEQLAMLRPVLFGYTKMILPSVTVTKTQSETKNVNMQLDKNKQTYRLFFGKQRRNSTATTTDLPILSLGPKLKKLQNNEQRRTCIFY